MPGAQPLKAAFQAPKTTVQPLSSRAFQVWSTQGREPTDRPCTITARMSAVRDWQGKTTLSLLPMEQMLRQLPTQSDSGPDQAVRQLTRAVLPRVIVLKAGARPPQGGLNLSPPPLRQRSKTAGKTQPQDPDRTAGTEAASAAETSEGAAKNESTPSAALHIPMSSSGRRLPKTRSLSPMSSERSERSSYAERSWQMTAGISATKRP